ncbi:D-alanine--D-alanine ligase [Herbiconiux sp. L3-i23]|uniref:D-alanine--D-alanine ligase family protein n=1 Tax=Herbiconiux sp. L3-i23 TaxID=2905871 RepID=UPI002050B395|nr:D-alanine--D-alanine ligase [Herbiconiux sp. L3-i23]BDI24200.1 D-alanine--D-alanine ligase [Herbiconiux sp. L3-i23]
MPTPARRAFVLAGGISHEREVSLRSGRRVADALTSAGWHVEILEPDAGLLGRITDERPDVVWPALHGASGEDGALRALLATTGVPFVGSDHRAARLAWDKPVAKTVVANAGGVTPIGVALSRDSFRELGAPSVLEVVRRSFPMPLVVKPARGGSSQGVTIVRDADALSRAMVEAYTYGDDALVEQFVPGVEIAVGVIDTADGARALPAVEIAPVDGEYDFEARYNAGETRFYTPARISEAAATSASELALLAHRSLGLRHLSRVDMIVGEDGKVWFLEANVFPGLTETSTVPQAIRATGAQLADVYSRIAESAITNL